MRWRNTPEDSRKIRESILFLFPDVFSRPGGIQWYSRKFLQAAHETRGEMTHLVLLLYDRSVPPHFLWEGTQYYCCGSSMKFWAKIRFVVQSVFLTCFRRPAFIICGHLHFAPLCWLIWRLTGIEYVLILHGVEAWKATGTLRRWGIDRAKWIIAVSSFTAQRVAEWARGIAERTVVIHDPFDGERFIPKGRPIHLLRDLHLTDEKVLLTVARLRADERYKGVDRVIESIPLVLREIPRIRYVVVGEGDDLPRLRRMVEARQLGRHVTFVGSVDDTLLVDYYCLCDVFVMPSTGEGFGVVFLEALACGKPVIAGNRDGSRDALLGGKLGLLVDPDNVRELADGIGRVLTGDVEPHLIDGTFLRREVESHFGYPIFRSKVESFLKDLIDGRS